MSRCLAKQLINDRELLCHRNVFFSFHGHALAESFRFLFRVVFDTLAELTDPIVKYRSMYCGKLFFSDMHIHVFNYTRKSILAVAIFSD